MLHEISMYYEALCDLMYISAWVCMGTAGFVHAVRQLLSWTRQEMEQKCRYGLIQSGRQIQNIIQSHGQHAGNPNSAKRVYMKTGRNKVNVTGRQSKHLGNEYNHNSALWGNGET